MNPNTSAVSLLNEWKLQEYQVILEKQGYGSISTWKDLTVNDLIELGFKTGHAKRFVRNVKSNIIDTTKDIDDDEKSDPNTSILTSQSQNVELRNKHTTVVLLGETGVGKSTLLYSIETYVNDYKFEDIQYTKKANPIGKSQTQECIINTFELINNNKLTIMDTPGIGDTTDISNDRKSMDKIMQYLLDNGDESSSSSSPSVKNINVFAFLIHRGTSEITHKLRYVLNELKCNLPPSSLNHFIVVLTRSAVKYCTCINEYVIICLGQLVLLYFCLLTFILARRDENFFLVVCFVSYNTIQ